MKLETVVLNHKIQLKAEKTVAIISIALVRSKTCLSQYEMYDKFLLTIYKRCINCNKAYSVIDCAVGIFNNNKVFKSTC